MISLSLALLLAAAPAPQATPAPAKDAAVEQPDLDRAAQFAATFAQPREAPPLTGPRMGQDALDARIPRYPNAPAPTRVGDTLQAHGVPMNIQSFTTDDDPRKVLAFYRQAFEAQHLDLLGDGDLIIRFPYPSITAVDPDRRVNLSVIAIRDGQHAQTTVLLALADMEAFQANVDEAINKEYGPLPPYPGGEAPHLLVARDGEQKHQVVSFSTSDAPEKVQAFYFDALGKQGFRPSVGSGADQLTFNGPQATWQLLIQREPKGKRTLVMATWADHVAPEDAP